MSRGKNKAPDPNAQARIAGIQLVVAHPLTRHLARSVQIVGNDAGGRELTDLRGGWGVATGRGTIILNEDRRGEPAEWAWVLTHLLLHLGMGHTQPGSVLAHAGLLTDTFGNLTSHQPAAGTANQTAGQTARQTAGQVAGASAQTAQDAARAACCAAVARLQASIGIGRRPIDIAAAADAGSSSSSSNEEQATEALRNDPRALAAHIGTGCNDARPDAYAMPANTSSYLRTHASGFPDLLGRGISDAVDAALDVAGGTRSSIQDPASTSRPWHQARSWLLDSYPLLGSVIASMSIVDDLDVVRSLGIDVAAVEPGRAEILINPLARLSPGEWQFVIAHEALHAALGHDRRSNGRDAYLYNVAADYVINGWLVDMRVGHMPAGLLFEPEFKGLSTEDVYDRIATDLRRLRKLRTLRGQGLGDMLERGVGDAGDYTDKDAFYRRALADGLALHESQGRGWLPGGLVEDIRTREHPPVPWDVQLAAWFDEHVPAPEKKRSYSRASRRQSSTPDIARPGSYWPEEEILRCTFGVVLDTSGSMSNSLLASALGAISAYAAMRDVPRARVVFCDAAAVDAGYLDVDDIAGRVKVYGRGGTVLQPGVDLLERADDFPASGPILIITDADCDPVRIRREHAFLVPRGAQLPFKARGPVFEMDVAAPKYRER